MGRPVGRPYLITLHCAVVSRHIATLLYELWTLAWNKNLQIGSASAHAHFYACSSVTPTSFAWKLISASVIAVNTIHCLAHAIRIADSTGTKTELVDGSIVKDPRR